MPIFILVLVALVLSFAEDGKPSSKLSYTPDEVSDRGQEISEIASDFVPQSTGNGDQESGIGKDESTTPEVSRVNADNTVASIELPTPIPQVAVNNSGKLEESNGSLTSPTNQNSTIGQLASQVAQETSVPVSGPVVGTAVVGVLNQDLRELPVAELPEQGQVAVERTQGILP